VKANIANIRSGPNTSDAVIWQVEKYHPLERDKKNKAAGPCSRISKVIAGWIHNSLLATLNA
jgi:SH3-like domain-containing protein